MKRESRSSLESTLVPGAEFLQFAVTFAQQNLEVLRTGDWLNLREDFERYMGQVSVIGASGNCVCAHPTETPLPAEFELSHFQALQRRILSLLQNEALPTIPVGTFHPVGHIWYIDGLQGATPGRRQLMVSGGTEACFIRMLTWLIEQEPPRRILACPECGKLFYRVKHQTHCSRRCVNRVATRQFRARIQERSTTKDATIELK